MPIELKSNTIRAPQLLVMDDDVDITEYIADVAELVGFGVTTLNDPHAFAGALVESSFDIIALDLIMPGKDGIELLRYLAERDTSTQLILMSGYDESVLGVARELAEAHGLQVLAHLMKPIRMADLQLTLQSFEPTKESSQYKATKRQAHSPDEISAGIQNSQFVFYFQPQVDLRNNRLIGFEALARWLHPIEGILTPYHFIETSERANLIDELTWSLIKTSLNDISKITHTWPGITVSINLSTKQLSNLQLPDQLDALIQQKNISPENIVIEITESGLLGDLKQTLDILARFRMKGFKMSIDDFGTGSAMYEQLQRMPVTELKIDKSFVMRCLTDKKSHAIVDTTTALAHDLKLKVVAEGVETTEVADMLIDLNCDIGQGYLYGRPESLDYWLKSDFNNG